MSTAAVMQLFDNDTSHILLYLTLGMLLCWMTHICFHRNRGEISVWFMWLDLMIRPFLDNGAVQLRGHRRALTLCWITLCHHMLQQIEWCWMTSSSLLLTQSNFSFTVCLHVRVCVQTVWFQSLGDPIWQASPLLHLPLSDISSSSCSLHSNFSHNLHLLLLPHPLLRRSPASFFSSHPSSLHCSNHDVLASTLSKWVMWCNYGVISGISVNCCNCTFVSSTANEMV